MRSGGNMSGPPDWRRMWWWVAMGFRARCGLRATQSFEVWEIFMKAMFTVCLVPLFALTLFAQGRGGRGFGGPGGFAGRGVGLLGAGPGSRTPITGAPYSATETLQRQQNLANGNQIVTKEQSTV